MSVSSIKLGQGLFQKERIISDLQKQNSLLVEQLNQSENLRAAAESEKQFFEKADFESKNLASLLSIEKQQLTAENAQLKFEVRELRSQLQQTKDATSEGIQRTVTLELDLDEQRRAARIGANRLESFQAEVSMQEKRCSILETQVQTLTERLQEKEADIALLKKSIAQKDHHVAILIKARDKLSLANQEKPNTTSTTIGRTQQQQQQQQPLARKTDSMMNETSSMTQQSFFASDDQIRQLKSKLATATKNLAEREAELKKSKDENFQLLTRLKNTKR